MVILITGGTSSGKSKMAEDICSKLQKPVYYIATMKNDCSESEKRIANHLKMRANKGFITIEKEDKLEDICFNIKGTSLLECVGNLLSNEMFKEDLDYFPQKRIIKEIDSLISKSTDTVIVSNDLFSSLEGLDNESIAYVKNLADINISLAEKADIVIEAVYSVPNIIKGEELCKKLDIF